MGELQLLVSEKPEYGYWAKPLLFSLFGLFDLPCFCCEEQTSDNIIENFATSKVLLTEVLKQGI